MTVAVQPQEPHTATAKGHKSGAAVDVAMEDVENRGASESKQQVEVNGKKHVDVSSAFVRRALHHT